MPFSRDFTPRREIVGPIKFGCFCARSNVATNEPWSDVENRNRLLYPRPQTEVKITLKTVFIAVDELEDKVRVSRHTLDLIIFP